MKKTKKYKFVKTGTYENGGYVKTGTYQDGGSNWLNTNQDVNGKVPSQPQRYIKDANGNLIDTITGEIIQFNPGSETSNLKSDFQGTQNKVIYRNSPQLNINPAVQDANIGIDVVTGIANIINNNNLTKREKQKYLKAIQPQASRNDNEEGLNNIPTYFKTGGGNWIQNAVKHPGRCHDMGGPDCPEGSPQYNLALTFKKHHGFHEKQNGGSKYEPLVQTNLTYVHNPGDTLTENQIPQAARQQWEGYGMHGNPLKNQQIAILKMLDGSKRNDISGKKEVYKLSSKDQAKIDEFINNMSWWDKTSTAMNPNQAYLPNPIYKNGGDVSSDKAKEILRDGTAQGHPLTDKQKRYFGWIAGGKKQDGGNTMNPIKAEAGEIFQDTQGGLNKIPDNADTHDDASGGVVVNNATKVLEDTGDKRTDIDSKLLLIQPHELLQMSGIKSNKPVTHSKAFELISDKAAKDASYVQKYLKKNAKSLDESPNDLYAKNSMNLNTNALEGVPTQNDVFQLLFQHQEQKKAMYGINDSGNTAQNGKDNRIWDADGNVFNREDLLKKYTPQQLDALVAQKKYFTEERYGFNEPVDKFIRDNSQVPQEDILRGDGKSYFPPSYLPFDKNYRRTDPYVAPIVPNQPYDPNPFHLPTVYDMADNTGDGTGTTSEGDQFPSTDKRVPFSFSPKTPSDVRQASELGINSGGVHLGSGVQAPQAGGPTNGFNAPLQWYDTATDTAAFIDALQRRGVNLDQLNLSTPKTKYLDPTAALQQGHADYNAALNTLPGNGVGYANAASLFGKKYGIDSNILGSYNNQNNAIFNAAQAQVTGIKNAQEQANQQSRELFQQKQVAGIEAQRKQLLTSMGALSSTFAQNAKYNREGNLLMKLFPAFNQKGDYSGYKYNFTAPNPFLYDNPSLKPKKKK